jgi:4-hydroxy-3-polyprenylbenzoate decarboxylase
MSRDVRDFLSNIEAAGQLVRVRPEVDPVHEIGALSYLELERGGPDGNRALLFERVRGSEAQLAVNLLASPGRFFRALRVSGRGDFYRLWGSGQSSAATAPERSAHAPCQECVVEAGDIDLRRIGVPTWNGQDGGPYIDMPCVISADPDTGARNCGIYRMMVYEDGATTGFWASPYRGLATHWRKAFDRGEPLPVAVALGVDPVISIAAAAGLPPGEDELAFAGSLRGAPVAVTPCLTVPLQVPADAEIILEGEVRPGDVRVEGPFGEVTGYYTATNEMPVFRLRAVTHRRQPIHVGSYLGKPPHENALLLAMAMEAEIMRQCRFPHLRAVHCAAAGPYMTAVCAVDAPYEGISKMAALAVLSTWPARSVKNLIVVDADVDVYDWNDVIWAVSTRMDPETGIDRIRGVLGPAIDPVKGRGTRSLSEGAWRPGAAAGPGSHGPSRAGTKVIIDATRPHGRAFPPVAAPHPDTLERMRRNLTEYGLA